MKEYKIEEKLSKILIKGHNIEFLEKIPIDIQTGKRIYVREVEIENDIVLFDEYRKAVRLLTSSQIKAIRREYDLSQKNFALLLGMGEVSINRYENGQIQTASTNSLMLACKDPETFETISSTNLDKITIEEQKSFLEKLHNAKLRERHRVIKVERDDYSNLTLETIPVSVVSNKIIKEYNDQSEDTGQLITKLVLQKLLYYVQGYALHWFGSPIFESPIVNWKYGPVVESVYYEYNNIPGNEISIIPDCSDLSNGAEFVIKKVVDSYRTYSAFALRDLTHEETPWISTENGTVISKAIIKNYFDDLYLSV